jgi:hypothetical protein
MLLQAISFIRPQYAPLHFTAFSLAGSVAQPTHISFHRSHALKQSLLSSAQLSRSASPASLHFVPFVTLLSLLFHSITFATRTAAYPYGSQVIPLTPLFGSLGRFPRTPSLVAERSRSHSDQQARKPTPHNQSRHPSKLLKPPHFPTLTSKQAI